MITVYPQGCTDFSSNGLGTLTPESCQVTHTLNGNYEVTLVHPIDERGKYLKLAEGRILRVPVPAGRTPRMHISASEQVETEIWEVYTGGDVRLNMRIKPDMDSKVIHAYRPGTEVVVIEKTNDDWWEVTTPDGKRGYMSTDYLRYVRTEVSGTAAEESIIEAKTLREQPFRIYKIVPTLDSITAYARHIYYDLMDNMIGEYKPSASETGASVFRGIGAGCLTAHDFTFYSDLDSTAEGVELINVNPAEAIQGDGGVIENYGGELERDWYDVYLAKRIGEETGIHIREGKNLTGISYTIDHTKVATRIKPKGTDADGNALYLPEGYIDSPYIGNYLHPKWYVLDVSEAKEVTKGDEKRTKEECYELMRQAVQKAFDEGADLPDVTLNVEFVDVTEIEEYRQYTHLKGVHMGDTVRVIARRVGVEVAMRMTQYTYDCLTRQYTRMTLGTVDETIEGSLISAGQIANGSLGGIKLIPGSVGTSQLADGAVNSLKIALAAIGYAHIDTATIDQLAANAIQAVRADIHQLVAGEITTDELYADLAKIAVAQITAANIDKANIQWAEIESLTAAIAEIAAAEIGTADIDYAKIKDLVTGTAIITEGVGGKLYIERLAVTEANMVSLTVGELMLKAADGSFVRLVADSAGGITTETVQVEGENIADSTIEGGKLIEDSITARELNVAQIFADEALIKAIKAANIDVADLFAAEATITELDSYIISASTIQALQGALTLWADERISLGVSAGVNTGSGILINETGVYVEGNEIDLRTSDGDEYVNINEAGVSASSISAPDVMPRYDGPTQLLVDPTFDANTIENGVSEPGDSFRSLKDALASLSYRTVPYGVTIYLVPGMVEYGDSMLAGCISAYGITIRTASSSNRATIYGQIEICHSLGFFKVQYVNMNPPASVHGVYVYGNGVFAQVTQCTIKGTGVSAHGAYGIYVLDGAKALVTSTEIYDCTYSVYSSMMAEVRASANKGNCRYYINGALMYIIGTAPCDQTSFTYSYSNAGEGRTSNVTVDQGTASGTAAPTMGTGTYLATSTASYKGSGSSYRTEVAQGWWDGIGRIRGCMWFDNSTIRTALSGKTILSATLRLSMRSGVGRGTAVTVELCGTVANSGASSAAVTTSYGVIGTTSPGETTEITIPNGVITDLVNGTINGLMLYSSDTGAYKERSYSKNYAIFDGQDGADDVKPMLSVVYQG